MTTLTSPIVEHAIGPTGSVTIRVASGGVTIQGTDGDIVRLSTTTGRDLHEDHRIETAEGSIELTAREGRPGAFSLLGRRFDPIHAEVPRGALIRLETASGSVHVDGLHGEQNYRAASGSTRLTDVSGVIAIDHVSGDVKIRATGPLNLAARTVSGDVSVTAPRFDALQARTMSGSVRLAGRFAGDGPFGIESVSGDVTIELDGPASIEGTSVAGRVRTDLAHRSGGFPGRRTVDIGDGGPRVTFRTVSGDLRVSGPKGVPTIPPDPAVRAPTESVPAATEPAALASAANGAPDDLAARRLAILQDLEVGRIDVDEASRRLAGLETDEVRATSPARPAVEPLVSESRWDHRA